MKRFGWTFRCSGRRCRKRAEWIGDALRVVRPGLVADPGTVRAPDRVVVASRACARVQDLEVPLLTRVTTREDRDLHGVLLPGEPDRGGQRRVDVERSLDCEEPDRSHVESVEGDAVDRNALGVARSGSWHREPEG